MALHPKSRFIEMFGSIRNNSHDYKVGNLEDYIIFLTSGSRGWSKYFSNHGEIFITIKNVKNTLVSQENIQYVIPPENQEAKRTKVQEGDLLISITADLGRTGVVPKDIAVQGAYINQHLSLVRLDRSFLNPRYVAFFLETDEGKEQFQRQNKSSVKAGLNFNDIKHLKILIPPKSAQDEFVNYVEVIDKSKLAEPQDKYFWWEILTLL